MRARRWVYVVLMAVMAGGMNGTLLASFAQAKDEMRTFDLDRILDLALERNPAIASARSVIEQNEGMRTQAGAYLNPTVGYQTANGLIRDPSNGDNKIEHNITVYQPVEYPGMRAARQDAAAAGLASATVGLDVAKLNLIAEVKQGFYELLLAERRARRPATTRRSRS